MKIEFKPHTYDAVSIHSFGRRVFRWVLETGVMVDIWSLGLTEEYMLFDKEREWFPATRYVSVALTRKWKWGENHFYYDGPHCTRYLGFFHFYWSWYDCDKCLNEA